MPKRLSRRNFLGSLGSFAAAYPLLLWSPKSLAGMVPFAFLRSRSGTVNDGTNISGSLRFRAATNAYLSKSWTNSTDNRKRTVSFWTKWSGISSTEKEFLATNRADTGKWMLLNLGSVAANAFGFYSDADGWKGNNSWLIRDPAAWYHIHWTFDSTVPETKLWINGQLVLTAPLTLNTPCYFFDSATTTYFGVYVNGTVSSSFTYDGMLAQFCGVDGQALPPEKFGAANSNGEWKPLSDSQIKGNVGAWGNNGFLLNFSNTTNTTTLGYDSSGRGNHWTCSNISLTTGPTYDALIDSPSNGTAGTQPAGNYCTLNPLDAPGCTLSHGNLRLTADIAPTNNRAVRSTFQLTSGKWYWEMIAGDATYTMGGIGLATEATNSGNVGVGYGTASTGYNPLGQVHKNALLQGTYSTYIAGDVIGFAFDADNGRLYVHKNGVWQNSGNPDAGTGFVASGLTGGGYFPMFSSAYSNTIDVNFGQQPWDSRGASARTTASSFKSLCSSNLSAAINKPSQHFNVLTYTGGTAHAGAGFAPDLVWIKTRNIAYSHRIQDRVRGAGTTFLSADQAGPENSISGYVTSFDSDGFTTNGNNGVTDNSVAWLWKAGGAPIAGTGTGGITNVQVSANPSSGFSIVTYTGSSTNGTVTHGLGVAPKLILLKCRNNTRDWAVWHTGIANTEYLVLNTPAAKATDTGKWNSTGPTSSVFNLGSYSGVNYLNDTYVAYCFAEVEGFSKIGSYTGNGIADGPFVYCGFRPRWLMVKSSTSGAAGFDWYIYDSARSTYNPVWLDLRANHAVIEDSGGLGLGPVDFVSNGFKMRSSVATNYVNQSGDIYVFAAFAEMPFKYANAR